MAIRRVTDRALPTSVHRTSCFSGWGVQMEAREAAESMVFLLQVGRKNQVKANQAGSKDASKALFLQFALLDRELQEEQKVGLCRSQCAASVPGPASVLRASGKECRSAGLETWGLCIC